MLGLWLVASHMVGDFVLSTRWQAAGKFDDPWLRWRHVLVYCLAFGPAVEVADVGFWRGFWFGACLFLLHYATDSRRFRSTLGDVIAWRFMSPEARSDEHAREHARVVYGLGPTLVVSKPPPDVERKLRLADNPWEPIPILSDQALHLVQLAVVGSVFLA